MTPRTASQECGVGTRADHRRDAPRFADPRPTACRAGSGAAQLIGPPTLREPPFSAELVLFQGGPMLVLRGELDVLTRGHIEIAFADAEAAGAPVRMVDLRELDFMDCAGLDGLVAAARRRREPDRPFVVVIGAGPGRRILELLDVSDELAVLDVGRDRPSRPEPWEQAG